ncbi:PP2C family protein-serine/threonine phosphatase [Agrococcus jenensis]|uniref:Serine phosphatase n=1 Tax=Agrococcus jenensis TaxID=46353 RepID=A0A3N2AWL4_9MICO|nr:GAF domain-containing SpoIIE family protein phosphatase [Agrococcus jenensis]ROR67421.1 serine phosphatase [Agrococcus jenensis]
MVDEEQRQRALEALGVLDTPPHERVDRITRLAKDLFDVPMVSVTLLDRDRQWRKSQIGLGGSEAPRDGSFCDATVRSGGTLIVSDAGEDADWADNEFVLGDPHLRFYAGHPLAAPGGEHVGTLCILDTKPRGLDARERDLLRDLAQWVQLELAQEKELDDAVLIQRALAPRRLPSVPGYEIAAGSIAAGSIAGDVHDIVAHGGELRVTLADVMGKGMGPAIIASAVRASLRTAPDRPIATAVQELDALLEESLTDAGVFVTAFHSSLDLASGAIGFVDAGHSLAFALRADGSWEQLRSTGLPLGMGLDEERTEAHAALGPGDALLCCSDGLLDVLDPAEPFRHVAEVLAELGPQGAVEEALRLAAEQRAPDDVTVIVVRRSA